MEKKRHHFVWREYLRSWGSNEYIFAYKKSEDKIINPNLMRIAVQNYFYSLDEFTLEEELILKELVKEFSNENALKLNLELYELYIGYSKIVRLEKQNIFGLDSEAKKEKFTKLKKLIKTNLFEEFHTKIESYGKNIIKVNKIDDLKILENGDELFFTMIFLCSQFLRTKKMKKKLELTFEKNEFIIPKYTNIISLVFANSLAISIAENSEIRYIFYENKTDIDFMTSDQPLMNLLFDEKDENGKVKKFEFYYPINPKIAIVIHFEKQEEKYQHILIDKKRIDELNAIICEYADDYIFTATEKQLHDYKNSLQQRF